MIFVLSFVILAVGRWPCVDKAAKNPPSTTVPPLFLRELRGEVRENVARVEAAYPAKVNPCFEPPRGHSKFPLIKCCADHHSSSRTGGQSAASVSSIPIV